MDDVWRMKKSIFCRGDWYPAVKKGEQALHKEGTVERTKQTKILGKTAVAAGLWMLLKETDDALTHYACLQRKKFETGLVLKH